MADNPPKPKPSMKPKPPMKPKMGMKPPMAKKPPTVGSKLSSQKTEEEEWLSGEVDRIKNEIRDQIEVVYQSLEELEEVHGVLMQQVIQRIEKKFGSGGVSKGTYDLMDSEYYDIVYDNVEKLVGHIDSGSEKVVAKIGEILKDGLNEILNSFKKPSSSSE